MLFVKVKILTFPVNTSVLSQGLFIYISEKFF